MLTEVFYTFVITTGAGLILSLAKMGYKSKCTRCKVCCIEIIRDAEAEQLDHATEMRQQQQQQQQQSAVIQQQSAVIQQQLMHQNSFEMLAISPPPSPKTPQGVPPTGLKKIINSKI